jgi:hypothetical protein
MGRSIIVRSVGTSNAISKVENSCFFTVMLINHLVSALLKIQLIVIYLYHWSTGLFSYILHAVFSFALELFVCCT